ncbi:MULTISPECIES: hypothetical protein [Cysteiniphilum]|uniref:Uncharacterized protein n=1 Tax=Cysteiniphilum litorale TaxID=2056700 RepID=A0A8J3E976_9GAMM|nr:MULTISPECIES: hypothetical protein [Cysteiniphilum]GGF99286.1 hypothetical protein GCM10010995_15690 [Cysteiniphilum litorale]
MNKYRNIKLKHGKEGGFALVLVMFIIALIVGGGVWTYTMHKRSQQKNLAIDLGNQVAMLSSAVRARLADAPTLAVGDQVGVNWLISNTCGGTATKAYLPCNFTIPNRLIRQPVRTEITHVAPSDIRATIHVGQIVTRANGIDEIAPWLAAIVVNSAKAKYGVIGDQILDVSSAYHLDKNTATISIDITRDATTSVWLHADGTNQMEATFRFNPANPVDHRELINPSNIEMNNTATARIANSHGGLTIQAAGNINNNATDIQTQATDVNTTAGNQIWMKANDTNITSTTSMSVATGSQSMSIDGAGFTMGGVSFNDNTQTSNLNSTTTNINTSSGTVYLGNQSGVSGVSNVEVNDFNIKSMGNKTLTQLLKSRAGEYRLLKIIPGSSIPGWTMVGGSGGSYACARDLGQPLPPSVLTNNVNAIRSMEQGGWGNMVRGGTGCDTFKVVLDINYWGLSCPPLGGQAGRLAIISNLYAPYWSFIPGSAWPLKYIRMTSSDVSLIYTWSNPGASEASPGRVEGNLTFYCYYLNASN